ncbi:MAG: cyclic pyranopterin monophosphate synthase MoaC [Planctomycetota bacterium]|jgi:cyclic pyranopterin phosphate synthase
MSELSHVHGDGRARMVDVGDKPDQLRQARAGGHIDLATKTMKLVRQNALKKGDVLRIAEIAGVQAAKRTSELIPLCHSIGLTCVRVVATLTETGVAVTSEVGSIGRTGVEMEALTAASVALLTIYDMCKAVDKGMKIGEIVLLEKTKLDLE